MPMLKRPDGAPRHGPIRSGHPRRTHKPSRAPTASPVMARLVRAIWHGTALDQMARTSRAMTYQVAVP